MAYNSITQLLPDIYPEGEEVLEFVCAHAQHATKDWLCLPQLIYRNSGIHADPRQNSPKPGGIEHSQANMSKTAFRPILQSVLLCVQQCFFNLVLNLYLKAIVTRLCTKYLKLEKHLPYLAAKSMRVFYSLSAPLQTQTRTLQRF